ncbi:MAG: HAMP domain-containing sensor histidine kinase [Campylobacterota bacterium]|nr:HAMP domain-containing sensor histidine kinase [Campylobacterota bacterium]
MKHSRSIYKQFSQKLIFATTAFIIVLSFIFYGFTKATIYNELTDELIKDAQLIYQMSINTKIDTAGFRIVTNEDVSVDMVVVRGLTELSVRRYKKNKNHFVEILYPFDVENDKFIKLTKNTNSAQRMLNKIFQNLFILGFGGFVMIILYAFTLSKTLLRPILQINRKLSNMNENFLTQIDPKTLPLEFHPLAESINSLTNRIQTFVKYQKELFIGAAHELKTPLAVIKLKSEVTKRKQREPEKYVDTLEVIINEVDDMNKMITSILDIGRQEGAQFEKPIEIDIIEFFNVKVRNYELLAEHEKVNVEYSKDIDHFITIIQPTLLNQIVQNFVQNAIKFTPQDSTILIDITSIDGSIRVSVTDEGIGIDESIDLFAPFKRVGGKAGAGLGLFLAKSAADALGAEISLKNRTDDIQGTVAIMILHSNPTCKI